MRFITVAIHTYEKALALRAMLEREGIEVEFRNVNIEHPVISSGVRVRIRENDLPLALRIIENREIFADTVAGDRNTDTKRPVLVPVDFSPRSIMAARMAFAIAADNNTEIMFLHTYIDPYVAGDLQLTDSFNYELPDSDARVNLEEAARTRMQHFVQRIKELIKSGAVRAVKFSTCVVEGVPEDAINDYTKVHAPFMIVMGTRNSSVKENELIGSVTGEVLDKCRFTVLAIPESCAPIIENIATDFRLKNILFLSNTDQEDILAMDTLNRIFGHLNPHVIIAQIPGKRRLIGSDTDKSMAMLADYCKANFKDMAFDTAKISLEKIVDEISTIANERKPDLIVIPNKKKNILSRLFNPSLAHKILFSADVPMLVIPV